MASPEQIGKLTEYCVKQRVQRVWIKDAGGASERPLDTFFSKQHVEDYLAGRALTHVSKLFANPPHGIETVAITRAFTDVAGEIGFDELQRLISSRLNVLLPDYKRRRLLRVVQLRLLRLRLP